MKELSLKQSQTDSLTEKFENTGYRKIERQQYNRFSKGKADATYVHHSLNIIRATVNTEAEAIILSEFGMPNGKASDSQDDRYSTWFFNGYVGKKGSTVY